MTIESLMYSGKVVRLRRAFMNGKRFVWFADVEVDGNNSTGYDISGHVVKAKQLAKKLNIPITDYK